MSGIVGNYLEARCRQSRHPRGNYLEARCHRASDDAHMEVVLLDRYAVCMKLRGVVSMPLNVCSVRISPASPTLHVEGQGQRNGTCYLIVINIASANLKIINPKYLVACSRSVGAAGEGDLLIMEFLCFCVWRISWRVVPVLRGFETSVMNKTCDPVSIRV